MAQTLVISEETLKQFALKSAIDVVHRTTDNLYLKIQEMSPIRTWEYASRHRNMWVRVEWDQCIGEVINDGNYSERVELWFWKNWGIWNRTTEVNWRLRNWSTYRWKWANTYRRWLEKVRPIFNNLLKW